MTIYDYKCTRCGNRFELLRSVSDASPVRCPKCEGEVARVYEGKLLVGKASAGGGGCGCGGNCGNCAGCGK